MEQIILTEEGRRILAGAMNGIKFRADLGLDTKDSDQEIYEIVVPKEIFSITPSFFISCFGPSIRKLGKTEFLNKYKFKCSEVIVLNIEYGIDRILTEQKLGLKPMYTE